MLMVVPQRLCSRFRARAMCAALLVALAGAIGGCGSAVDVVGAGSAHQLTAIAVGAPDASVAAGLTSQYTATGLYSDGSREELSAATWSSSATPVASINATGLATTASTGTTTITATYNGVSGTTTLTVTAAKLASIGVTPAAVRIAAGENHQFTATGVYTDNTTHDMTAAVKWSSSAAAVATVANAPGSSGLATTVVPGAATVTATFGGLTGTAALTVTAATLASIEITPANASVAAGMKHQFTATGVYSDHSTHDLTTTAVWSSSAPAVAGISNTSHSNGLATALSPGSTTLTATFGGVSGTTAFTVTAATVVSIGVTPAITTLPAGLQPRFTATGVFSDNSTHSLTNAVVWSSSAPAVASISNATGFNGVATTQKAGVTTITATLGGVSGSTTLTVNTATLVSIAVTPATATAAVGTTQQFSAIGTYSDQSTQNLTAVAAWSSDATPVAAISNATGSQGLATAQSPGSVTITAAVGNVSGAGTLSVTAMALVSIGLTPSSSTIANGTGQQFTAIGIYSDNSTQGLTAAVTWSSSAPAVAAVSNAAGNNGLATAAGAGTTTITATLGGISASTPLTVTATTLVAINLTPANPSLASTSSQQFTAIGVFSDNSVQDLTTAANLSWSSSMTAVASISNAPGFNGLATAASAGATTISAALGSISGSTTLTVSAATLVSIAVTPASASLPQNGGQQFIATGTYSDGSTQDLTSAVTWNSGAAGVATVSNTPASNGLASAVSPGSAAITATLGGVSGSAALSVTAATLVSIAVTPPAATIPAGVPLQFTATGTYSDNSLRNITTAVTWLSSSPAVAAVSNASGSSGLATSLSLGSTSISAAVGAISSTAVTLTVAATPAYAYVANQGDGTVDEYAIPAGGALAPLTPADITAGTSPESVVVDPTGHYAYVANEGDDTVSQFSIQAGGVLAAASPATVATGSNPISLVLEPTGRYAYVVNTADDTVSQYAVGAGGLLSALSPATAATGASPQSIAVDPTGNFVYVANSDGTVSQFTIASGGALLAMSPASIPAGGYPQSVCVDATGRFVYVANGFDNTVSQYAIGTNGVLSAVSPTTVATGTTPEAVIADPAGPYVYVANQDGTVSQYGIGTGGALNPLSPATVQAGSSPQSISIDPSGRYAYVTNNGDNTVSQFTISSGVLTPASTATVATGSGPYAIATAY
jgi:6-phosphogluconolactonase (cycloisomerase 2 family)